MHVMVARVLRFEIIPLHMVEHDDTANNNRIARTFDMWLFVVAVALEMVLMEYLQNQLYIRKCHPYLLYV